MSSKMSSINSVSELVDFLDNHNKNTYRESVSNLKLKPKNVEDYCTWDRNNYTRNLIHYSQKYHLLILCWQQGQYSPIHDHGGRDCYAYVVEGLIQENIYQLSQPKELINCSKESIYKQGQNSYITDDIGMHSLKCVSDQAITLHLYAKPIESYHVFNLEKNKLIRLEYLANKSK